jgi:hypothetical protein
MPLGRKISTTTRIEHAATYLNPIEKSADQMVSTEPLSQPPTIPRNSPFR